MGSRDGAGFLFVLCVFEPPLPPQLQWVVVEVVGVAIVVVVLL